MKTAEGECQGFAFLGLPSDNSTIDIAGLQPESTK